MSRTTTLTSSSTYDGRTMKLTCTQTTNGSSANTSTINWTLTASGGQYNYDTGPTTVKIAGEQRYYKARTSWSSGQFPAASGSVNGKFTLSHKQDGSIDPIELSLATAIFSAGVQTDRKTFELESIARYFSNTPTLTLKGRTETSLTFNWKTSETCSSIIAHVGGKTQTLAVNGTSGSFTVSGLTVNTAYSTYGEFTRKDSGLKSNSATTSYSTYNYPYITAISKPKLKIGEEQVITVFNPLGRSVKVRATDNSAGTSGIYAETTITGTSATLSPKANLLYAAIPNSQTGTIYYNCFYNNSMTNNKTGNFEILGTETPTFNGTRFSFMDSNTDVTDVTAQGENGWLVQDLSTLKVTLDELAVGNNGANISKYDVTIAGDTIEIPGSIGSNVSFANLNLSGEQTLSIKVTDSRGLVTTGTKTVIFKPYSSPTISLVAKRENNYGEDVKINTYFSSSSVEGLNGIKVSWSGASQSGYLKGSSTTFDETQSTSAEIDITGVDNSNPYIFSATIIDKFGRTSSSQSNISIGVPTMFIDYEQNGVGVNCFPEGEGIWTEEGQLSPSTWKAKKILENSDINDYTNEGVFYCDSDATVGTMTNTPDLYSFSLRVYKAAGVVQVWNSYYGGIMYVRRFYNGGWIDWKKVVFDNTAPTFTSLTVNGHMSLNNTSIAGLHALKFNDSSNVDGEGLVWKNNNGTQTTMRYYEGRTYVGDNTLPKVFIQSGTPSGATWGDIWFKP